MSIHQLTFALNPLEPRDQINLLGQTLSSDCGLKSLYIFVPKKWFAINELCQCNGQCPRMVIDVGQNWRRNKPIKQSLEPSASISLACTDIRKMQLCDIDHLERNRMITFHCYNESCNSPFKKFQVILSP